MFLFWGFLGLHIQAHRLFEHNFEIFYFLKIFGRLAYFPKTAWTRPTFVCHFVVQGFPLAVACVSMHSSLQLGPSEHIRCSLHSSHLAQTGPWQSSKQNQSFCSLSVMSHIMASCCSQATVHKHMPIAKYVILSKFQRMHV